MCIYPPIPQGPRPVETRIFHKSALHPTHQTLAASLHSPAHHHHSATHSTSSPAPVPSPYSPYPLPSLPFRQAPTQTAPPYANATPTHTVPGSALPPSRVHPASTAYPGRIAPQSSHPLSTNVGESALSLCLLCCPTGRLAVRNTVYTLHCTW